MYIFGIQPSVGLGNKYSIILKRSLFALEKVALEKFYFIGKLSVYKKEREFLFWNTLSTINT